MMTSLEQALTEHRLSEMRVRGNATIPDGMAWVFEDTPASKPLGLFTLRFARVFCEDNPYYCYRKVWGWKENCDD